MRTDEPFRHRGRPIETELIATFIAVARASSFVAAARQLDTDPSVVSRRVRRLEEHLGARLLARTTRQVALTEVGERYLLRVADLFDQLDAAGREAAEMADSPRGLLRVSAPLSYGKLVIGPLLARFLAQYPHVHVDLRLSDRRVDLVAEGFDIAIRSGPLRDSSLIVRRLASYRDLLLAAPAYLARYGRPASPAALANHACIGFSGRADWSEWRLTDGHRTVTVQPRGPLIVDSSQVLMQVAADGAGIVLMPEWLATRELADGRLVRILPRWRGRAEGNVHALMPPGRLLPAKTRVFLEALEQAIRSASPPRPRRQRPRDARPAN